MESFSLDQFGPFLPGKTLDKTLKTTTLTSSGNLKTVKAEIVNPRYKIALFLQTRDDQVIDMYARLPSFFLHDVFLQALINRYGKKDLYNSLNNNSIYRWNNRDGLDHLYQGSCTITCFPVFYSVSKNPRDPAVTPLIDQLSNQIQ